MQTLEAQLFVITFTLALLTIIIFLYKVMIRALGGPDKKEKQPRKKSGGPVAPAEEATRRPVIRRQENSEEGGAHG